MRSLKAGLGAEGCPAKETLPTKWGLGARYHISKSKMEV